MVLAVNKKSIVVTCIVTGTQKKLYGTTLKKRLAKFGSNEEVADYFILPAVKKLLRQGKTVDEIRELYKCPNDMSPVDPHILARLKLLKKRRKKNRNGLSASDIMETDHAIGITKEPIAFTSFQHYVEEVTGGPNRIQIVNGGTCQRPDLSIEYKCPVCPYYKYCLCTIKQENAKKFKALAES